MSGLNAAGMIACAMLVCGCHVAARRAQPVAPQPQPFVETVPGSSVTFTMRPVTIDDGSGMCRVLWFAETETTWDAYDVFYLRLDEQAGGADVASAGHEGPDAITRPTLPYAPPDRGWGHDGFAAVSITFLAATKYCEWLSKGTGRPYRLPREGEFNQAYWDRMHRSAALTADSICWHQGNSSARTHTVASRAASDDGLHDLIGNVAEWCVTEDGTPGVWGGSFKDPPQRMAAPIVEKQTRAWQANDPSFPKSKWWLSDAPFVGFRVVCEEGPK
jgi:hypothetical protein